MKIATWNVNGIRARQGQLFDWIEAYRPDVICLQEIKASPAQVPTALCEMEGYWSYWHGGEKGYSGVAQLIRKERFPDKPEFSHPSFDYENRLVTTQLEGVTVASIYVPNGGKDYQAKLGFLGAIEGYAAEMQAAGTELILCGDINIARTDRDVHPKERKANAIGQLPEEREWLEKILGHGLTDVGRAQDPDNDDLFTWWAPWRNLRQRNIGWRIDYILASSVTAARASACTVFREVGTSDHAPVLATFD